MTKAVNITTSQDLQLQEKLAVCVQKVAGRQRELGLQQIAGTADMPIDGQPSGQMTVPFAGRGIAYNDLPLQLLLGCL